MLETNRLKIYAASQDIMKQFIEAQTVDVLRMLRFAAICRIHLDF